jgi:hypothetical protein
MEHEVLDASTLVYRFSQIDIWSLPSDWYNVQFQDKLCLMHKNQLIGSWYYWELFRHFPEIPIKSESAVTEFYTGGTHLRTLGFIHWDIFFTLLETHSVSVWEISGVACEVSNSIFNVTCVEFVEYMPLGSIHDIVGILKHPRVVEAKKQYKKAATESRYDEHITSKAMVALDNVLRDVLYRSPELLPDNAIKRLATLGLCNENQLLQLVGMRGYVKDVDDGVFPFPVETAYAEGFRDLYEIACESRDAANAKRMQEAPLQLSEYFNRKNQLNACVVTEVTDRVQYAPLTAGGCTGFITVPSLITETDVSSVIGKFHMVDDKPELLWYDNVQQYVGKIVQFRSMTGCGSVNPQHVCHICLGWSSLIQPPGVNVGYKIASESGKIMTSRILGTKHSTKSSTSTKMVLDKVSDRWLQVKHNVPGVIFMRPEHTKTVVQLRIPLKYAKLLNQIQHINVLELSPTTITKIPQMQIAIVDSDGNVLGNYDTLKLQIGGVGVSLTTDVLHYIKEHGYRINKSFIEIDLDKWKIKSPLFITPNKGKNVMTLFNDIKAYLEGSSTAKDKARVSNCRTRAEAINELVEIMKDGMGGDGEFNLVHIEVLIKGLMVIDNDNPKDFSMPMPHDNIRFDSTLNVISGRSLGGMLAMQKQFEHIHNLQFLKPNQTIHHMMSPLIGGIRNH